jgi:hypothetical protein
MTPEERDRLARLETVVQSMSEAHERMEAKLDKLLAAAAMGRGAWMLLTKQGMVLLLLLSGIAWLGDRLHWWMAR